jgi:hypothetical protein
MALRHRLARRTIVAAWFASFVSIALAAPYLSAATVIGFAVGAFVALNLLSITRCADRDACEHPLASEVQHGSAVSAPPKK